MNKSIRLIVRAAAGLAMMGLAGCCCHNHGNPTQPSGAMTGPSIEEANFGNMSDGTPIQIYTLRNSSGMEAKITTYGGIVTSLKVPDKNGNLGDVVLGFDDLQGYTQDGYVTNCPYFGALIGRYGNRIGKAKFSLDGNTYTLAANNGPNNLHGGPNGFDKVVWTPQPKMTTDGPSLQLTYLSKDGDQGFPGNLTVIGTYTVMEDNSLRVVFKATTDKDTVCNLTHHSYFNLAGHDTVLGHVVYISADKFTPVDSTLIPTGELRPVAGTPFDFTTPTPLGAHIGDTNYDQIAYGNGYDHNFALNKSEPGELSLAARVTEPESGRVMEVWTTAPGLQLYTGNGLNGNFTGKGGWNYLQHDGFCMEAQGFPDSPNQPAFPSTELKPGDIYNSTIIYKFSVAKN